MATYNPKRKTATGQEEVKFPISAIDGLPVALSELEQMQIPVTHKELVELRDKGELIAGRFYRITDYLCVSAQSGAKGKQNRFDIIVQSLSNNILSEKASADFHKENGITDNYFEGCKLSAWELKYSLDNDIKRFAWAFDYDGQAITNSNSYQSNGRPLIRQPSFDGATEGWEFDEYYYAWGTEEDVDDDDGANFVYSKNETVSNGELVWNVNDNEFQTAQVIEGGGRGVVYYMKDENGNECPYDFKNIQFKRNVSLEEGYPKLDNENGVETWVYTFCGNSYHIDNDEWSELKDGSLESPFGHIGDDDNSTFHHNVIAPTYELYDATQKYYNNGILKLNNNVFFGYWEEVGSTSAEVYPWYNATCCHSNVLDGQSLENTFGLHCSDNIFGLYCKNNIFGMHFRYNRAGAHFKENTIADYSYRNTFEAGAEGNTFLYIIDDSYFGAAFHFNTINTPCYSWIFEGENGGLKITGNTHFASVKFSAKISNKTINLPSNSNPLIYRAANTQEIILD